MRVSFAECPCCDGELYVTVTTGDGVFHSMKDNPRLQQDAKGYFMKCRHCSKRVALKPVPGPLATLALDDHQNCDELTPM